MKVRITTQHHHGSFDAELDEGMTADDLFGDKGTVSFTVSKEEGSSSRVRMLRRLTLEVEEEPVYEQVV